ncbi:MAG TPA: helix-turn-helix domain-containing protein [Acholeplasmataceae bacterium]|nr:helix-turn-helix domain-containing protein [Acholeplasmataceae bacterium]
MTLNKPILTPREAAELLGVGYKTVLRLAKQRDFPAFRVGERKIRISAEGLAEWKRQKMREPLD